MLNYKKIMLMLAIVWFTGLSTLQVSGITGTMIVSAETVEDEDKDKEGEDAPDDKGGKDSQDNVFGNMVGDGAKKGRILGAISYSEQMQYLMTYTILSGNYMEHGGYSGIYTGGSFASGYGNEAKITVEAGTPRIYKDDQNSSDVPHKSEEDVSKEAEKAVWEASRKEAIDALVPVIANELVRKYIHKYHLTDKELKIQGTTVEVEPEKTARVEATDAVYKLYNKDSTYGLIRKQIENDVEKHLYENKPFESMNSNTGDTLTVATSLLYREENYVKVETKQVHRAVFEYAKITPKHTGEDIRRILAVYPYRSNGEYINSVSHDWNYDKEYKAEHDEWYKKARKVVKDSPEFEPYEDTMAGYAADLESGIASALADNVKGLSWIPLDIRVEDNLQTTLGGKYDELIKAFDGGEIDRSDGRVFRTLDNGAPDGARSVQINDFINMPVSQDGKISKSASPYFTYDYDTFGNELTGSAYIGKSSVRTGKNLGIYSGMKMQKMTADGILDWVKEQVDPRGETVEITEELKLGDITGGKASRQYHNMGISAMAGKLSNVGNVDATDRNVVGVDNYGNIISGTTLAVLIPYWHNTEAPGFAGFGVSGSYFISTPIFNNISTKALEAMVVGAKGNVREKTSPIDGFDFMGDVTAHENFLRQELDTVTNFKDRLGGGAGKEVNTQALALAIVSSTKTEVETFNKQFVKIANEFDELYMGPSSGGRAGDLGKSGADKLAEFSNKDLLERIMLILDIGVYELMRLTIASWVVSFYTASISNFSMSAVFHTTLITDTAMWGEVVRSISFLLMGFMGIYILIMAFKVFRRTMAGKDFIKQFLAVTLVLIIPTVVYAPVIHFALNKPTQGIVGTQLEQMSLLDAYLDTEAERREDDPMYAKLFGEVEDLRDRTEDYVINFYTTMHVDGFDVMNVDYEDLSYKNQFRSLASQKSGEWRKTDLIKVRVSIFDVFRWAEADTSETLFKWLALEDGKRYGDVGEYDEFKTSTAVSYPELGVYEDGSEWAASELYKKMFKDTASQEVQDNITALYKVTESFRNRGNDRKNSKITDFQREALVRDLSMTSDSRETLYGSGDLMSPSATELMDDTGTGFVPGNDFLALADIVNDLVPYRDMTTTTLDRDVYNINKTVIDNYITNYSIVRETVGGDVPAYNRAEFHMIVMHMWFSVNNALDLPMFPRTYEASTVSFDSYMRMAFIPMKAFVSIKDKDLDNVAQYIALREHPATLLMGFLPALVMLMAFALVYIAMFYVLMMVILTGSFIWHYVIKNNKDNKSWLGAIMIIGAFAIAKIGLLLIWKIMSWYLNYSYVLNDGLTYPYVAVHSIAIIGYILIIFRYLFLNVIRAVLKDKENLGGEIFGSKVSEIAGKFGNVATGKGWGGGKGGSGKGDGASVKAVTENEGEHGKIRNMATSAAMTARSLTQMLKDRTGVVDESKDDITSIQEALNASGEMGAGQEFSNRFGKSIPGLRGKFGSRLAKNYDNIDNTGIGLTEGEQAKLESSGSVGSILSTTADGENITRMDAGNEANAVRMVNHLKRQGIEATSDGSEVTFNSSGYDLTNKSVRKALFDGMLNQLLSETKRASAPVETKVEDVKDYSTQKKGEIAIGIGGSGIDTESLQGVMESDTFKESFDVVRTPVVKDGKYLQGELRVIPKNDEVNVDKVLTKLYGVDDTIRKIKGKGEREVLGLSKAINFTEEEMKNRKFAKTVNKHALEGMRLQGNQVLYNETNEEHVKAAAEIARYVKGTRDKVQKEKSDMMLRVVSQVTQGGNSGFHTTTENTANSEDARAFAQSSGIAKDRIKTTVFTGENTEDLQVNLEQMRNLINADHNVVSSYMDSKHELYIEGESIMNGKGDNPDKVYAELTKYAKKHKVEEKHMGMLGMQYSKLGKRRQNANITESEYAGEVESISSTIQVMLQDNGKYEELMTETLRKDSSKGRKGKAMEAKKARNTDILNRYVEGKKELTNQGVNVETIEKYRDEDYDVMGQLIGDIEGVKTNKDGTISITSSSRLSEEDTATLIGQVGSIGKATRPKVTRFNEQSAGETQERKIKPRHEMGEDVRVRKAQEVNVEEQTVNNRSETEESGNDKGKGKKKRTRVVEQEVKEEIKKVSEREAPKEKPGHGTNVNDRDDDDTNIIPGQGNNKPTQQQEQPKPKKTRKVEPKDEEGKVETPRQTTFVIERNEKGDILPLGNESAKEREKEEDERWKSEEEENDDRIKEMKEQMDKLKGRE